MDLNQILSLIKNIPRNKQGCKIWPLGTIQQGYPYVWCAGQMNRVSRLVLTDKLGRPIQKGMLALHRCNVTTCVCDEHLYEGTNLDNARDRMNNGGYYFGDDHPSRKHPECWKRGDEHYSRTHPEYLARGEQHGCAKLTENDVREIRRVYALGGITTRQLAKMFGMTQSPIHNIIVRRTWKHVD